MANLPTLFEDLDLSGLPTSNPGGGRLWVDSDGFIRVGIGSPGTWILADGVWSDIGVWDDSALWID